MILFAQHNLAVTFFPPAVHANIRMEGRVGKPNFYHRVGSEGKEVISAFELVAPASHLGIVG
jgi:hypothetical protein